MNFLNTPYSKKQFEEVINSQVFVDKTKMIEKVSQFICSSSKYLCITRPRRFGKTINANMLATYYGKEIESSSIFNSLKISELSSYKTHLNQHNVVYINFADMVDNVSSYEDFKALFFELMIMDLKEKYPNVESFVHLPLNYLFRKIDDSFIFIFDEWDCIFQKKYMNEGCKKDYLGFLKSLLKDQPYVDLVYMTGVLPIAKYSSGSELNMFREFSFLNDDTFSDYFGFTESEVKELCLEKNFSFDLISEWYNGYYDYYGNRIYNPRSVSNALTSGNCQSYWTSTGPMDEISWYIENNVEAVRDDVIRMVSNEKVQIEFIDQYSAEDMSLNTRDEILSAMVVYGFLSYHDGYLSIPNKELMIQFNRILQRPQMKAIYEITKQSDAMLKATLNKDTETMCQILESVHQSEISILHYNNENSISYVISLVYLSSRNFYRIEREEKSGKGYADFIFHPERKGYPAIILELKVDDTPEKALQQIKEKNYLQKISGPCLLVGISYDKASKNYSVIIEEKDHRI